MQWNVLWGFLHTHRLHKQMGANVSFSISFVTICIVCISLESLYLVNICLVNTRQGTH